MPATTPNRGYPYPVATDPVDIPGDLQRMAEAINDDLAEISQLIQQRPAAQVRQSQPLSVAPGVSQTLIPFDTVDYDNGGFFQLTSDPHTLRVTAGSVYWVYACVRFPGFNNAAIDPYCRIEIISPTPAGTFVQSDNVHTEDANNQGILSAIVHAGGLLIPSDTFDEFRVSVRHNSDSGAKIFTDGEFGVFQVIANL